MGMLLAWDPALFSVPRAELILFTSQEQEIRLKVAQQCFCKPGKFLWVVYTVAQ